MRRPNVRGILAAAAIAAIPVFSHAAEEVGRTYTVINNPERQHSFNDAFGFGKFRPVSPGGLFGGSEADVDGTFLGGVFDPGDGSSWFNAANWSTNPQIPDGAAAIARFTPLSFGAVANLAGTNVTLSRLDLTDNVFPTIAGNGATMTLAGGAQVHADGSNFDHPAVIFNFTTANSIGGAGTLAATVAGSAGLNKTGDSHIVLGNANTFSGAINVSGGGKIISSVGDPAFGAAGNSIMLNNGSLQLHTVDMITNRTINVGAGGGTIHWVGAGRTFVMDPGSNITGSGRINFNGAFGGPGPGTINTAASHTGAFAVTGGQLNLTGSTASQSLELTGILAVHANGSAGGDKLTANPAVNAPGGALTIRGNASGGAFYTENVGNVLVDGSTSIFTVSPGPTNNAVDTGAGARLNMGTVSRGSNKGTVQFRGFNLGQSGANTAQIHFSNGTASLVNGIIPWAMANAGSSGFGFSRHAEKPESSFNTLATYGPNGVTPVTTFVTDITASGANDNVRLQPSMTPGPDVLDIGSVNRFANALVINATESTVSDPGFEIAGTGTINLTTGVILSATAGFNSGGALNSLPGNIISANINAGSNELIIHSPAALTINGPLHGTGGLTAGGGRTLTFNAASTYTGDTFLSGFLRYTGNITSGTAGAFGAGTSAIVLYGGGFAPIDPDLSAAAGTMVAILALDAPHFGPSNVNRPLIVRGEGGAILRNFSLDTANGVVNLNAPITVESDLIVQGFAGGANLFAINSGAPISGPGRVEYDAADVTLSAASTYTGGTDAGGILRIGVNSVGFTEGVTSGPFGMGPVDITGSAIFIAQGAPRTIINEVRQYTGTFSIGNQMTFAGPVDMVGFEQIVTVPTGETGTISGNMSGAGLFKEGLGTLVLSGNNTHSGFINVGQGAIEGGMLVLASNNAVGTSTGWTGTNGGNNTIALPGGITIGNELAILRGHGVGGQGALRNLAGTNTWGGTVLSGVAHTVGVDSGQLNLGASWFSVGSGTNAGMATANKVGPGTLTVNREQFTAGTSSFRGAIIADTLNIQQGTVRLANVATGGPGTNQPSVSEVLALQIAGGPSTPTARLDLGRNAMVVDFPAGGPSPLADIQQLITAGNAGGTWAGNGITSSDLVGTDPAKFNLFAFATPANIAADATFLGLPVDSSAVLVFPAIRGDANLDWRVDLTDFNALAANFGNPGGAGRIWTQGDFTGDGIVDLSDFNVIAANFGLQAGPDGPTDDDWAALAGAVPEPASLALVGLGALTLMRRRRRA